MTELERRTIRDFVEENKRKLPDNVLPLFEKWNRNKEIVAKQLKLTEDQKLYITKRGVLSYMYSTLSVLSGFTKIGATAFAKQKGTTKILKRLREIREEKEKIDRLIPNTIKRFDAEMDKLNKKSR